MNIKYSLHASLFILYSWILLLVCNILFTYVRIVVFKIFKSKKINTILHLSNVIKLREIVNVFVWFSEEYDNLAFIFYLYKFLKML